MRFIADGPWLPDELLTARDAGQVIFFCGAGVSQAEASLPNFPTLAGCVLKSLGSAQDSPARRLFKASQRFEAETCLTGIVATDRIFGLLEREFDPAEVREAVANALRPPNDYKLDAHRTMLDLSRDRAGVARLVTTNFDRLFEECDPSLGSFNPPHLPDPRREKDFRGIIHIHGRVDTEYRAACDDEFVLSSSDFGRAYLADGWATRYIQSLLQRYKVVFVGYSADDPPVQYLLEALSRSDERPNELYAFQAGHVDQAAAQWTHKGVNPIPYESADRHAALWQTLRAWAERARDVDAWYQSVIALAARGPTDLRPHERGLVAHLAATREGARRLVVENPLPAAWLCVLDPVQRYKATSPANPYKEVSERFDPFEAFGLDSDKAPLQVDPKDLFAKREVPNDAWDLFASTKADRENLPLEATGRLRDADAASSPKLPARLWYLGMYLNSVAHQSAALWWAAHQANLHPDIVASLERSLRQETDRFSHDIRRGWRLLIAAWRDRRVDPDLRRYEFEVIVKQDGWSTELVRAMVEMYRPVLIVRPPLQSFTPPDNPDVPLEKILWLDVEYPHPHEPLIFPEDHLAYAVLLLRGQIEHAIALEQEVRGHDRIFFDTMRSDDGEELDEGYKLTRHLRTFTKMITRLAALTPLEAKAEFACWPRIGNQVFVHMRIWAASQPDVLGAEQAAEVFLSLDDESFWNAQHQRDLLYALRDRWTQMADVDRRRIEQRLFTGNLPWPEVLDDTALTASYRLNRLQWLHDNGVHFESELDAQIAKIRRDAPGWEPRFASGTARPHVGPVTSFITETSPAHLVGLPLGQILAAARESARIDFESAVEHRHYLGLAQERPALALAVLTDAARKGEFAESEWATLLHSTSRGEVKLRLLCAVGLRVSRLKLEQLVTLRHPVSEWLHDRARTLFGELPDVFRAVWTALAAALVAYPPPDRFHRSDSDWVEDGFSQPAGRLVCALLKDPATPNFGVGAGLSDTWKVRLEQLLALPGDARRHAIAMISPHLNWLYNVDPEWAGRHLLGFANRADADGQAFWGGYFWAARTPQLPLYMRLKPAFIALARVGTCRRDYSNKLAGMLLAGLACSRNFGPRIM
ncbi:SIR2 family protein [Lichenicoccus sp.]|uniref:SIR2 family protein n=1 Tax=Lichenicoccus sp. TaxID=2781899 RepID=UPI003D0EDFB8